MTKSIAISAIVFLLSGCLCLPGNKLQTVPALPSLPQDIRKPTFSYQFSYEADPWIARAFSPSRINSLCNHEIIEILKESSYFESVIDYPLHLINKGPAQKASPFFIPLSSLFPDCAQPFQQLHLHSRLYEKCRSNRMVTAEESNAQSISVNQTPALTHHLR